MADEVSVATRVSKPIYEKLLNRQKKLKKLTGIEPSVSAILRSLIEEATANDDAPKRRRA